MARVTLVTAIALGLSVFSQAGSSAAAEQQTGGDHAAPNTASDPASRTTAVGASNHGPSDTSAADAAAPGTKVPDDTAAESAAPVCFKLTSHCIDSRTQGSTAAGNSASGKSTGGDSSAAAKYGKAQPLNLNAPDVRSVVPVQELKEPLPGPEEQNAAEETNTVQVAGDSNTPDVPGGFGALWWAIRNPSQAWRILAPVQ